MDDNRDAADSIVLLLGLYGYDALARYDGPSGLKAVEEYRPDACVLDLNMPGMDGDELAMEIKARHPDCHLVFVAMTAQSGPEAVERTHRAGFRHHLVKPVAPEKLLAVLEPLDHELSRR